jgi:hypothetical protein
MYTFKSKCANVGNYKNHPKSFTPKVSINRYSSQQCHHRQNKESTCLDAGSN